MKLDWVVLCEAAETDPQTGRPNIKGAGVWRLDAKSLPVKLAFFVAVMVSDLPVLFDDDPGAVTFDLQAPNGDKYDSMSVQIQPTVDMRPEWGFGFAILGYDVVARQFGRYRLKVTPTDGDPVFAAIHVAEPGTPSPE